MPNAFNKKQAEIAEETDAASQKTQRRTPDQRVSDGLRNESVAKRDKHSKKLPKQPEEE